MQRILLAPALPLFLLTVGACDPTDAAPDAHDEAVVEAEAVESEAVELAEAAPTGRTLLREVQLSETHVVRFWALEDGTGAVEESFHAELDAGSALPQDDVKRTLAELHRIVLPAEEVPAAVLAVDEFTAEHVDELPIAGDDAAADESSAPTLDTFTAGEREPSAACIGLDWEADRQWFVSNFCVGGNHKDCVANWTAINSWRHDTSWFRVYWFNQSMEASANVKGGHRNCWWDFWSFSNKCEWDQEFNHSVPNRTVQGWTWTGNGRRYVDIIGYGECARVGMAQMWNTQSEGGGNGGVNPNPAGACNYIGEACCAYQNVAGFYCDATYDAQLYCSGGACVH